MANSLDRLREHLKNGDKLVLKNNEGQSTDDITKATMVETRPSDGSTQDSFPLNEETEIEI